MYIDIFNQKKVDAALCSIEACGDGINITAKPCYMLTDGGIRQKIEATEVHRIDGQDKTVYVYRIITKGTLEEKIALILKKRTYLTWLSVVFC